MESTKTVQVIDTFQNKSFPLSFLQEKVVGSIDLERNYISLDSLTRNYTVLKEPSYYEPPRNTFPEEYIESSFTLLMESWCEEKKYMSFLSDIVTCPSYQKIIEMGELALSLILVQLRKEGDDPNHWFTALEAITGHNPVPESAYGNMVKMAETWLFWAEKNNVSRLSESQF